MLTQLLRILDLIHLPPQKFVTLREGFKKNVKLRHEPQFQIDFSIVLNSGLFFKCKPGPLGTHPAILMENSIIVKTPTLTLTSTQHNGWV